jgi:hypothetical protein
MFQTALEYLANPTFFAGFSIIIGVAYVVVWVISLKEIIQPSPESYFLPSGQENDFEVHEQHRPVQSPRRRNDRVRVRQKFVKKSDEQRRGRSARAA